MDRKNSLDSFISVSPHLKDNIKIVTYNLEDKIAIFKYFDWISVLASVAEVLIPFVLENVLSRFRKIDPSNLSQQSLITIEEIVKRQVREELVREYKARSRAVLENLKIFQETNERTWLTEATNESTKLMYIYEGLGLEGIGALFNMVTLRITVLLTLAQVDNKPEYKHTVSRMVKEFGYNGYMGHKTNELRNIVEKDYLNIIQYNSAYGDRCHIVLKSNEDSTCQKDIFKKWGYFSERHSEIVSGFDENQCNKELQEQISIFRRNLEIFDQEIYYPWRNTMAHWQNLVLD